MAPLSPVSEKGMVNILPWRILRSPILEEKSLENTYLFQRGGGKADPPGGMDRTIPSDQFSPLRDKALLDMRSVMMGILLRTIWLQKND